MAAPGAEYCTAHRGGQRAETSQPQPCPLCQKRIKKGQMMIMGDNDIPRHLACQNELYSLL